MKGNCRGTNPKRA
jgi:membrane associated rhomboid family serine protease